MIIDFKDIDFVSFCVLLSNEIVDDIDKTFRFNPMVHSVTDCC